MGKIVLTPGEKYEPTPGVVLAPVGSTVNNTSSNTTRPPHPPVLVKAVLADDREDSWLEYVPEQVAEDPPLIIACHGGGASAEYQFYETTWWAVCEAEGAIAVFPNAGGQSRSWLSEDKPTPPGERPSMLEFFTKSPDGRADEENHHIKFIKALIEEMKAKYGVDPGRVYMQGMSMGDIMTMMFSRVCGDLLAGGDSTAGPTPEIALFNEDDSLKGYKCPVPTYQSRGELDDIVVAQRPGREVTTRQDVNAGNREFWLRVNGCDTPPRLAILGVNNFAFYTGKNADFIYRDVKHRSHGQTLDDAQWAWNLLFKHNRREPDGSLTRDRDEFFETGDRNAVALCEGAAAAYVDNKKVILAAPIFARSLTKMNFATHEREEVSRELFVAVEDLGRIFGGTGVELTNGGRGAIIRTLEKGDFEVVDESAACLRGSFMRAMFMAATTENGKLSVPLRWFAEEIFGLQTTQCDGCMYISDRHGEMTKDMAYIIRGLLK